MMEIRTARPGEAMFLYELSASVGWNHTPSECAALIGSPTGEIIFAIGSGGEPVGSAGICRYGKEETGFINLVIVRPEFRRRGVATRLIEYLLEKYRHIPTMRLHATPEGSLVYSRLGFRPQRRLGLYSSGHPEFACSTSGVRELREEELPAAVAADRETFGFERAALLEMNYRANPRGSLVAVDATGAFTGFSHARNGRIMHQISALSADSAATALALAALRTATDPGAKSSLVVYDFQLEFQDGLVTAGYTRVREMIEMEYGLPGKRPSSRYFAVWGGDLG